MFSVRVRRATKSAVAWPCVCTLAHTVVPCEASVLEETMCVEASLYRHTDFSLFVGGNELG